MKENKEKKEKKERKPKKERLEPRILPVRTSFTMIIKLLYAMIAAPLFIYSGESIIREDKLYEWLRVDNGDFAFWMSSIVLMIVIAAISLVTTKLSVGVGVVGALSVVVHGVHYFKIQLRGEPFFPWDVFQYKEAADIAGDVKIEFTEEIWQAINYAVILLVGAILIDIFFRYSKGFKYYLRLALGACMVVVLYVFTTGVIWNPQLMAEHGIQLILWDEKTSYDKGGFFVTFLQNAENMVVDAPDGYSEAMIDSISANYKGKDGKKPNVICIMSEAFAYPSQWTNVKYAEEITPYINSIIDECITGKVMTPSYGGGTSISEYEVLTGNCASSLPYGSVPYMQYVTTETYSYASFLKGQGYSTVAIHPYTASFWCRNKAYPLMGFDKFLSQDDFENPSKPKNGIYISDMDLTNKIISEYEAAKEDGPFFAFCVSMQNHGSYYSWEYGGHPVELEGDHSQFPEEVQASIRSYAQGIQDADEALGALIDYFREVDSETVILLFGDHQPALGGAADLDALGLTSQELYDSATNTKLTYTTPYIIWNNYGADVDTSTADDFSMYQLLPYMTERLDLARPGYFEYLSDVRKTVLAGRTGIISLNPDGTPVLGMTPEHQAAANNHWQLQYDMMFGKDYSDLW